VVEARDTKPYLFPPPAKKPPPPIGFVQRPRTARNCHPPRKKRENGIEIRKRYHPYKAIDTELREVNPLKK